MQTQDQVRIACRDDILVGSFIGSWCCYWHEFHLSLQHCALVNGWQWTRILLDMFTSGTCTATRACAYAVAHSQLSLSKVYDLKSALCTFLMQNSCVPEAGCWFALDADFHLLVWLVPTHVSTQWTVALFWYMLSESGCRLQAGQTSSSLSWVIRLETQHAWRQRGFRLYSFAHGPTARM